MYECHAEQSLFISHREIQELSDAECQLFGVFYFQSGYLNLPGEFSREVTVLSQ